MHSRIPSHLSAVQRSLQNDQAALSRLTNGTMFNKLHGLNGSSTLRTSNTASINNPLLRFNAETLASSTVDSNRNDDVNSSLVSLAENSKLDLSNFGLMAARLGYSSYFGTGASTFDNFAQLSNFQLNAAGADAARNLFNANNDLLNNQNGSEMQQSDDEDVTSITSWDEEMINQETDDDEDDEILMNQTRTKKENKSINKKRNENRSTDFDDNPDDDDNIDIMDDVDK